MNDLAPDPSRAPRFNYEVAIRTSLTRRWVEVAADSRTDAEETAKELCEGSEWVEAGSAELLDDDRVRPDGPETDRGGLIGQQPY